MPGRDEIPTVKELIGDLREVYLNGIGRSRSADLPALRKAAGLATVHGEEPLTLRQLLQRSHEHLGSGPTADSAAHLWELAQGSRGKRAPERREDAAEAFGRSDDRFRKIYLEQVIEEMAEAVREVVDEEKARTAHKQIARREPAESALAVDWVRRFEGYYRMWTPIWGLGADLISTRLFMIESEAAAAAATAATGESRDDRVARFAAYALYRYAWTEWERQRFVARFGGLWLLSNADTETIASDLTYEILWHTPFDAGAQSTLRVKLGEAKNELSPFLKALQLDSEGKAVVSTWGGWIDECSCTWTRAEGEEPERFPTWRHHSGISEGCRVHRVIDACGSYCDLIDSEWLKLADWYHLDGQPPKRGLGASDLYDRYGPDGGGLS
jgi:hypothetical protein